MTQPQMVLMSHAASVASERDERRRELERTCVYCNEKRVSDGVCDACHALQPVTINVGGTEVSGDIEWPPGSGIIYTDGEAGPALEQLKRKDPKGWLRYQQWALAGGVNKTAQAEAERRGLTR